MGYSADTFTAGEQPTTAKWNKLWSNDASFNDGTGIASLEIGSGHTSVKLDYKFGAYRSAALNASSNTTLVLDTKLYDTGTNFSTSTGLFTAPIAGFYQFEGCINVVGGSSLRFGVGLAKNGTELIRGVETPITGTAAYGMTISAELSLSANDTIGLYFVSNNSGATTITTGSSPISTYLFGYLSCQT